MEALRSSGPPSGLGFWPVELREQIGLGLLHRLGGGQVGLGAGLGLQGLQLDAGFEAHQLRFAQQRQARQRRIHVLVAVALDDLALGAGDFGGEQAGAVHIQPGVEHLLVERVDEVGVLLRDVAVAHVLAHDAGVLALGQGVVVAVARA